VRQLNLRLFLRPPGWHLRVCHTTACAVVAWAVAAKLCDVIEHHDTEQEVAWAYAIVAVVGRVISGGCSSEVFEALEAGPAAVAELAVVVSAVSEEAA
jgi:hypothetical protein